MDRYAVYRDISPGYVGFDMLADTLVARYHDRRDAERAPGATKPIRCRLLGVLLLATLTGCAGPYYAVENNDTTPARMWKTEGRTPLTMSAIPVGSVPIDLYFATQEGCEAYRAAHPAYTKPEEVCVAVKNTSVPAAPTYCDRQHSVEYGPGEPRGICWR
jgi:hypothetical protein